MPLEQKRKITRVMGAAGCHVGAMRSYTEPAQVVFGPGGGSEGDGGTTSEGVPVMFVAVAGAQSGDRLRGDEPSDDTAATADDIPVMARLVHGCLCRHRFDLQMSLAVAVSVSASVYVSMLTGKLLKLKSSIIIKHKILLYT